MSSCTLPQRVTKTRCYRAGLQTTFVNAGKTVSAMLAYAVSNSDGEMPVTGGECVDGGSLFLMSRTSAPRWECIADVIMFGKSLDGPNVPGD